MASGADLEPTARTPAALGVVPEASAFVAALAPGSSRARPLRKLHAVLAQVDPRAARLDREEGLVRVATWLRKGGSVPAPAGSAAGEPAPVTRLRYLASALEAFPALALSLGQAVGVVLANESADDFLGKTGIPGDRGLFAETVDRLSRGLMPQPIDEQDVSHLLDRMFPSPRDARWIAAAPADLIARIVKALAAPGGAGLDRTSLASCDDALGARLSLAGPGDAPPRGTIWRPLRESLLDALLLLASRASAAGLSDVIRARSPEVPLRDSPFFRLPRVLDALLATRRDDDEELASISTACRAELDACRRTCQAVLQRLEATGVSLDVVYRLDLVDRSLGRIEALLSVLVAREPGEVVARSTQLFAILLLERHRDRSLADIVRTNTHLLARKIIERAGHTGEHYITVTAGEYAKMVLSAVGGGVVMGFTTLLKFLIGKLHRPPLQEGLLAGCNYAGSFLLVQMIGATIATKQASMTAAAIAGTLREGGADREALVTTMARLVRSQIAAAFGNVVMVAVTAFAIDVWWTSRHGAPFLDVAYAEKVLANLHPTQSGTIPFAMYTGFALWVSSLCAGWLENWAVYRRLPEAIAEHRVQRLVGARVTGWASRVFARNVSGIGGNLSIGFLLGLTNVTGAFVGVPIDVRHITLSTGQATFALRALGVDALSTPAFWSALGGLACVLTLNLTVSFSLAIIVAMRAREVSVAQGLRLVLDMAVGFARSPLRFFLPVERGATPAAHP